MKTLRSLLALAFVLPSFAFADDGPALLQHFRPYDHRGVNVFETPKAEEDAYDGFVIYWGASFAQQLQALSHRNAALPNVVDGVNRNELVDVGPGFNLAAANLYLGAQLADGIRLHLTTYLSSRHHPDAWVRDGYILVDRLPMFDIPALDAVMDYVTVRAGHMEINYGDAHFRRTDNANAMHNPFVENLILDAFTTEIGGEVYFRTPGGLLAMAAMSGGEIQGSVVRPDDRAPAFYGKAGYDGNVMENLRLRLTGSVYHTERSLNNTLYGGDRAGSRYFFIMENTQASAAGNFTSGRINPGFRSQVTAMVANPFVKFHGLEFFGTVERASGRAANEDEARVWNQYAGELVYRFLADESLYLGARYNVAQGELAGGANVRVDRLQAAAGWFVLPQLLVKAEYVQQWYHDFPDTDIRHRGRFQGMMLEGVIAF